MKAQFLSENYLKENSPINDNVDMKLLKTAIIDAQEIHILESLGTGLYNDLSAKVVAGSLSSTEESFIETYLRPALKNWSIVEGIPLLLFKLTNKTVATSDSDNSKPVEYADMRYMVNLYRTKAEVFTQRMKNYLIANSTLFPTYGSETAYDAISPSGTTYTTSWYLD